MSQDHKLYGLMAEFSESEQISAAAKCAHEEGYRRMDAFTPFPVEDLPENLGYHRTWVPAIVLAAGITGAVAGYFMQWYAMAADYPLDVGGRPLNSWPQFIPITFELTVLSGALAALIAMLALNRLPQPHHPVFNAPGFERASMDRFFLCIEASDPKFDATATNQFLKRLNAVSVTEVEA